MPRQHGGGWLLDRHDSSAGLLPSVAMLDGPGFDSTRLRPDTRDFYEHTAAWDMEVWTSWSPLFWPAGELVARLFGRRVEQLALPMRPLDVAHGMDSQVTLIRDAAGGQVASAWMRTLRTSGRHVFSGGYSARNLPGADRPSVHVAFPLESGNVQVFLRPTVTDDGGLLLESPPGAFGQDGAYVAVRDGSGLRGTGAAARDLPRVRATIVACCAPTTSCASARCLAARLHYRLERAS